MCSSDLEHVDRYQATGGEEGHDWQGTHALLLTTTGRKSGQKRTTPLIYDPVGDGYAIVASKGGADEPPAWYLNLTEDPTVEVQVKDDVFTARARTVASTDAPTDLGTGPRAVEAPAGGVVV